MTNHTTLPASHILRRAFGIEEVALLNDGKPAPWAKAKEIAGACTHGGHTDWRLPTVEEAFLIPDRTKFDPAINTAFFPFLAGPFLAGGGWIWTSTVDASDPESFAWFVFLSYGYSDLYRQDSEGLVLAVRGSGVSPGQ